MGKGSNRERGLLTTLREHGYEGVRVPSSGSSTSRDLPDLLVSRPDESGNARPVAIEAKYVGDQDVTPSRNKKIYVGRDEVEALIRFADRFGAKPLIFARWSTRIEGVTDAVWWVRSPDDLPKTEKNYRLDHSEAVDEGWDTLNDWA